MKSFEAFKDSSLSIVTYVCITLFTQIFFVLQNSLMSPGSGSRSSASNSSSTSTEAGSDSAGGGARPRAGSDSASRGPVGKVMDLFRHRSHSAVSAEEKRKAVSTLVVRL